jgi:ribonuclease R
MTTQKQTRRHPDRLRGRIAIHVKGFGFVDFEAGDAPVDSAFVAPPDLNPFLAGDLVEVTLEASEDERYRAFDLALVERLRGEVIGKVETTGGRLALRLDPRLGNTSWPLSGAPQKLQAGTTVIAEPGRDRAVLRHVRTVDAKDAGRAAVLVFHRIRTELDPAVRAEAKGFRFSLKGRRDLRAVPTLTIDAAESKDLDDALAVLPPQEDGALRILVSIADVDAAVPAGSRLDREARLRGTSVYLADLVVPMLPPELSEQGLSLLEGAERPALTVELRIDTEGEVTAADLSASVIRSTARLTYAGVAAFLDRGEAGPIPEKVREPLLWLRTAASRLAAVRAARGGVTIEPDEVSVDVEPSTGEPLGVSVHEPTSAHLLVERLMVATNEAVAGWLIDRGLPALFRVQDELEREQIERLAEFAANFGFRTAFGGKLSPRGLAAFEEQFRSSTMAPSIRSVLRWFLGRARYQAAPSPHYALAAPAYLHFTSPIRRYPDLVVHRVIKAHLEGQRELLLGAGELEEIAAGVNDAARRAEKAEADRARTLVARLFAGRVGERHPAHIVAVKPFGLVVRLDDLGVTGTVAIEALGPGRWELDKATYSLVSRKRRYMIGEAVEVRVASTDEELGRLDLELAG